PFGQFADFHTFAAFSGIFVADITLDIEPGRLAFKFFGDFPADADHIREVTLGVDLDFFYGKCSGSFARPLWLGRLRTYSIFSFISSPCCSAAAGSASNGRLIWPGSPSKRSRLW